MADCKEFTAINGRQYAVSMDGVVANAKTGRILKPRLTRKGYLRVDLGPKSYLVHRLVASLYLSNSDNLPVVNHIDGIKANNHVSNLEWVTHQENIVHAFKLGLRYAPINGHKIIRHMLPKYSNEEISAITGVPIEKVNEFR
jgi:hypothetical protein